MANTLSGPNIEEEYLWSVTLDSSTKEYSWNPKDPSDEDSEDDDDPSCKPNHRLLIKTAILHPSAKKDEVTMLEIETKGYKEEKVVTPFLAMKGGSVVQQYVDLLIPDASKIKLLSGAGPITLVGSHCVDFYDYRNFGGEDDVDDEEEAESSEDDEPDMEEQETAQKEDSGKDKKENGDKKKTPKKDSASASPAKASAEKPAKAAEGDSTAAAKKTPDSKKRKPSGDLSAEKKRKKSDEK